MDAFMINITQPPLDTLHPTVTEVRLGKTPALKVEPHDGGHSAAVLIYVHGGGFTMFSARSSLAGAALMAAKTGLAVYSIDYTIAPEGKWQTVTDQVLEAYGALLAQGHTAQQIGLFADSAGGSIVAGSVLKMRDNGIAMPGALILQSPWSDVTDSGDTYRTLKAADPILSMDQLKWSADAYATPADQKNPYVSPVYGDYNKGFPPTLIQGGTREIFLSNFVRHYQAIERGGGTAVLDLYEGMPHDFQMLLAGTPESDAAYARAAAFWSSNLAK
jgi:epsilon-lactone hydrolase